jgi:RNA polymerase sigma-70 factor (ECF subfamily)
MAVETNSMRVRGYLAHATPGRFFRARVPRPPVRRVYVVGEPVDAMPLPMTAADDEADLVRVLEEGAPAMMALATRMLGNPEDAREVLQDAWFRAWQRRGTLRSPEAVGGWVRAIVVRECLRTLRWRSVRRWFGGAVDVELTDPGEGPEIAAENAELRARVRARVETLPARQRLVWGLRFDEGWSVSEIAEATGLRPDTVKTHLGRALEALREVADDRV